MLSTENNNGYVKVRSMFNGKQSRVWKNKDMTDIPTAENEYYDSCGN